MTGGPTVCAACGSPSVFVRAWVALNDPARVELQGDGEGRAWCAACQADVEVGPSRPPPGWPRN